MVDAMGDDGDCMWGLGD
jgi:hypothetical protein